MTGYKNVIQRFKERTGLEYSRRQFKNKWDKLKGEYDVWKKLTNKQIGIGWDAGRKNIDMAESWWKQTSKVSIITRVAIFCFWNSPNNYFLFGIQEIKGCMRFRHRGLQNEDKLEIMFEDLRNTGDDAWCASSGVPPSQASPSCDNSPINVDEVGEDNIDDDSEPEAVTLTSAPRKRSGGTITNKGKKSKSSTGHWFQE